MLTCWLLQKLAHAFAFREAAPDSSSCLRAKLTSCCHSAALLHAINQSLLHGTPVQGPYACRAQAKGWLEHLVRP